MSDHLLQQSFTKESSIFIKKPMLRIFVFQCLGTILLAMGICCAAYYNPVQKKQKNPFHDLLISLSLYVSICFFAPLTGGFFNPVVTLAVYLNQNSGNKMEKKSLLYYFGGQFLGAAIGCAFSKFMYDCGDGPYGSLTNNLTYMDVFNHSIGQLLGTFSFCLFILIATTSVTTFIYTECWVHLFIPIALFASRTFSYFIGGINPAMVFVLQIVTFLTADKVPIIALLYTLAIIVGSFLGSLGAALFFNRIYFKHMKTWRSFNQ